MPQGGRRRGKSIASRSSLRFQSSTRNSAQTLVGIREWQKHILECGITFCFILYCISIESLFLFSEAMKLEEEQEEKDKINKERQDRGEFGPDLGINYPKHDDNK